MRARASRSDRREPDHPDHTAPGASRPSAATGAIPSGRSPQRRGRGGGRPTAGRCASSTGAPGYALPPARPSSDMWDLPGSRPARALRYRVARCPRSTACCRRYDRNEVHSIVIRATADRTMAAVQAVTAREIRLFATLNWIRGFRTARLRSLGVDEPDRHARPGDGGARRLRRARPRRSRGRVVRGRPLLVGVGREGSAACGTRRTFRAFAEPGTAKAAVDFRIEDETDTTCRLRTETRNPGSGRARAAALLKLYWFFVHPGSALMRRMWLRAVKRRAERSRLP